DRRADRDLRAHPRPQVRRAGPGGRAAHPRRLRRRDGQQAHPRGPAGPAARGRRPPGAAGPAALADRPGPGRAHPGGDRGLHRGRADPDQVGRERPAAHRHHRAHPRRTDGPPARGGPPGRLTPGARRPEKSAPRRDRGTVRHAAAAGPADGMEGRNGMAEDEGPRVAGLLLAAGAGSRLGRPKALVELAGERLAERGVRTLREAGCAPVLVVTGAARVAVAGAEAVHNPDWASGMGSSLRAGLDALPAGAGAVVVALADQPLVTAAAVRRLIAAAVDGARVAAAAYA